MSYLLRQSAIATTCAAALIGAAVLLGIRTEAAAASKGPTPHELGRYIGWLVSCGAIQGNQEQVGAALRRSIERYNPWEYTEGEIESLIKSVRFGFKGRLKYDNGEQVCAQLTANKQNVEWVKQLLELGR